MQAAAIDVRTKLILLLYTSVTVFAVPRLWVEITTLVICAVILMLHGNIRTSLKYTAVYTAAIAVQFLVLSHMHGIALMTLSIFAVSFRRLLPCILAGKFLLQTTTASEILYGLQRFHIPREVTIPLAVTVRYLPAVKEELQHIRDAKRLRRSDRKGGFLKRALKNAEYYYVPLLVSAAQMSEEISAAAITRGIEDPCRHTSLQERRMRTADYMLICGLILLSGIIIYTERH